MTAQGPGAGMADAKPLRARIVSSLKWQAAAQAAGQVVTWLSTLVVIRLLAPEDYGLLAMAGVVTNFFLLAADLGVGAASVQALSMSDEDLNRLAGLSIAANAVGFILTMASAPLVSAYFREPELTSIVFAQSVSFLLMALYTLPQAQLMRAMDFRRKAKVDMLASATSAAVALIGAVAGAGVWALVGASIALHIGRTIGYRLAAGLRVVPQFDLGASRRFLAFGLALTADRILFFAFGSADVVIGGRVLGSELLGVYSVAMSIAVIPLDKLVPVINQVSFAAFSRFQDDRERVQRGLLQTVRIVSLGAFPIFIGLAVVAPDLVRTVLSAKWASIVLPLQLLCVMLPLRAVAAVMTPVLFSIGKPGVGVLNRVIALGTIVAALGVGVRFGIVGMCIAWLVAYPAIFAVTTRITARAVGVTPGQIFDQCTFPALATAAMAGLTWLAGAILSPELPPALRLGVQVLVGAGAYLAAVMTLRRGLWTELRELTRD